MFVNVAKAKVLINLFEVWWLGTLRDTGSWEHSTIDQLFYQVCIFFCVPVMLKVISFPEEHIYLVFCVALKDGLNTHTNFCMTEMLAQLLHSSWNNAIYLLKIQYL